MSEKLAPSKRHQFIHNGQLVYEWDQTLSDVNVFVRVPEGGNGICIAKRMFWYHSGIKAKDLYCKIEPGRLEFGIGSNPPYLSEALCDRVVASESIWTLEDGVMTICLQKAKEGETWKGAFEGHILREDIVEEDKKRLLLERFQTEHAGFDFSGAEVSGTAPNPRTFLKDDP